MAAMSSVRERRDMAGTLRTEPEDFPAHGVPTHSAVPSSKRWCFQIGTEAFKMSIRSRQASNAWVRCGQDTASTTARSPTARSPTRCTAAMPMTGYFSAITPATRRSSSTADGCALYDSPLTPRSWSESRTAPANSAMPPAAGSATAARTSSTDSSDSRTAIRRTTLTRQGYLVATVTPAGPPDDSGGADHGHRGPGRGDRGLLARDPAAGQCVPALPLVEQDLQRLGVADPRTPAGRAERGTVHHPRVHHVPQVYGRRRGHPDPVQPLRGAERQPGGQLAALQPADLLPLVLLQPAVAAHREVAGDPAADGELQRRDQVIDVAELPAGRAALHGEQPRRLEVPGHQRVDVVSDQGGGSHHGHRHARVG